MTARLEIAKEIQRAIKRAPQDLYPVGEDYSIVNQHDDPDDDCAKQFKKLVQWRERYGKTHTSGDLDDKTYTLQVTRPGCKFKGKINGGIVKKLSKWYNNAATSGFGNVKTQKTEINADVRNAREILASEFTVQDRLLRHIEKLWATHFMPTKVRAEPYKIHLYGPGGQFRPHRDTPEKDLVGTFLVGLGDSTKPDYPPRFSIGDDTYDATAGQWVAFYPDVPHEVKKIQSGYRAVIAFKLFRSSVEVNLDEGVSVESSGKSYADIDGHRYRNEDQVYEKVREDIPEDTLADALESIETILRDMPLPVGLHLTHKYPKGITELSGFDAILFEAANNLPDAQARFLPIMLDVQVKERWPDEDGCEEYDEASVRARVYPLTEAHVDFLLGDEDALERDEISWIDDIEEEISFYSTNGRRGTAWYTQEEEIGWTGNDSRGHDEYSIYLSYAMVIFPGTEGKQKALAALTKKAAPRTKGKKTVVAQKTKAATTNKVAISAAKGKKVAPAPEVTAAGDPVRRSTRKRKATEVAEPSSETEQRRLSPKRTRRQA